MIGRMGIIAGLGAAAILACTCSAGDAKSDHAVGIWGGPHVGVDFLGGLADVQFDCASGTLDDALYPGRDGSFSVKGTYRTGAPGPVKVGQFFTSKDAIYSGQIAKGPGKKSPRVMSLSVTLEDGTHIGPFTLTEGTAPQLTRCLAS